MCVIPYVVVYPMPYRDFCRSTSKGNVLLSLDASFQSLLTPSFGFSIHLWALSPHEGLS
jgi:hypothetical protein